MNDRDLTRCERAQLAMILEVTAFPKPGNVDRCHDYRETRLEHFLASAIFAGPALEHAEHHPTCLGSLIRDAGKRAGRHSGGNTHFGAFLLLVPLVAGGDIQGATSLVHQTTIDDAVEFYRAFGETKVRVRDTDELDVRNPAAIDVIRERGMTLLDIMRHSATNDMVAREWADGFPLTRRGADLLHAAGCGRNGIVTAFLELLCSEPDTFIIKEHGRDVAEIIRRHAGEVLAGQRQLELFDEECILAGINPGSIADLIIAAIYVALGEGWQWDCPVTPLVFPLRSERSIS